MGSTAERGFVQWAVAGHQCPRRLWVGRRSALIYLLDTNTLVYALNRQGGFPSQNPIRAASMADGGGVGQHPSG